jgi:hypothetical protein
MYATLGLSVYFKQSTAPTMIAKYARRINAIYIKALERRREEIKERDAK